MDKKHMKCWVWKVLWIFSLASLLLAWWTGMTGSVFIFPNAVWFWNALIFGILAIPVKLDCKNCEVCNVKR